MTALYAGTEKGAEEVKKFFDKGRVNRVILLSDGMANIGPSDPSDLKLLGQKIGGEGITVTTQGLGARCSGLGPGPPGFHAGCTPGKPAQPCHPPLRPLKRWGQSVNQEVHGSHIAEA